MRRFFISLALLLFPTMATADVDGWVSASVDAVGPFQNGVEVEARLDLSNMDDPLTNVRGDVYLGPVGYRFEPHDVSAVLEGSDWEYSHYLMLDNTSTPMDLMGWSLDVRSRVRLRLGDTGVSWVQARPSLSREVRVGTVFVDNEFFLWEGRNFDENRLRAGVKLGVADAYYMWRKLDDVSSHVVGLHFGL